MSTLTTLSGIVVLTGPRPLDSSKGPRNLLVDATIYAHDDHTQNPSVGLVHFFNDTDISFGYDPVLVHAVIHFAIPPPTLNPELRTPDFTDNDYCFIGDIAHVTLLPDSTDACQECFIVASGSVDSISSANDRTFTFKCDQYISFLKSSSASYLMCSFPKTTRWEKTSLPKVNSSLTVAGTLEAVNRTEQGSVSSLALTIEAIGYPSQQQFKTHRPLPSTSGSSSSPTKTGFQYSHAPQKRKARENDAESPPKKKGCVSSPKKDKEGAEK